MVRPTGLTRTGLTRTGLVLLVLLVPLALAACGKRGDPEPPHPDQATWPRPPVVR